MRLVFVDRSRCVCMCVCVCPLSLSLSLSGKIRDGEIFVLALIINECLVLPHFPKSNPLETYLTLYGLPVEALLVDQAPPPSISKI